MALLLSRGGCGTPRRHQTFLCCLMENQGRESHLHAHQRFTVCQERFAHHKCGSVDSQLNAEPWGLVVLEFMVRPRPAGSRPMRRKLSCCSRVAVPLWAAGTRCLDTDGVLAFAHVRFGPGHSRDGHRLPPRGPHGAWLDQMNW